MSPVIALLGAESTGKTTLARELAQALTERGIAALAVPEYLREFCDAHGRTPTPAEQHHIADEQWRRIETAAREGWAIADTTPLMTAVYSDFVFGDTGLYASAQARQARCTHTLVTGLDIDWRPDGLQRDGPQVRGPVDALVRAALDRAALPYAVVYGEGPARLAAALSALRPWLPQRPLPNPVRDAPTDRPQRLSARCRECLLPGCEHLLFARVAAADAAPADGR
jgi:nicotinamide riboside kinase